MQAFLSYQYKNLKNTNSKMIFGSLYIYHTHTKETRLNANLSHTVRAQLVLTFPFFLKPKGLSHIHSSTIFHLH